ncbi:hypothetical protein HME9302_00875 [Alteripontixanthobacter maritimus]|uniref:N-acetyltransferase domain-containing protein n=1 Tax=Alteripontixanthobacter maritimus TaxID=2161824 RepID=A0A369Q474_9SPHN|nr:GNAT family N-acetyltransferase [Alteripontixanthobacter maritimus]RDC59683.1 hypothetical protein HME9302_00875 [Alteripontixanthobacter maritimus]
MALLSRLGTVAADAGSAIRAGKLRAFLAGKLRNSVWARVEKRHVLYRLDKTLLTPPRAGLDARRYKNIDALDAKAFSESGSGGMPRQWYEDRFAEEAVLWAAVEHGDYAAFLWVVTGAALPGWYIPLQPRDKVVYAVVTAEAFKGRGLAPDLVRAALLAEQEEGADMLVDCKVWNSSARRAFEKVGFKSFATVPPSALKPFDGTEGQL